VVGLAALSLLIKKAFVSVNSAARDVFCNNAGAGSIYSYRLVKNSRSVRKPGSAYGINLHLIYDCFERRNHDGFLARVGADSKCVANTVRRTKRL